MDGNHRCSLENCALRGKYRCGQCKTAFYCSAEHQKAHWAQHKRCCRKSTSLSTVESSASVTETHTQPQTHTHAHTEAHTHTQPHTQSHTSAEQRVCRCMFCGEELRLSSEDEAVAHMSVCPALQEQLDSREQFTVPEVVRKQMKKS